MMRTVLLHKNVRSAGFNPSAFSCSFKCEIALIIPTFARSFELNRASSSEKA